MNNKREITGWVMYDWANSAFATTVVTAFLGPFLVSLIAATPEKVLPIGPFRIEPEAFYPFCVTLSVILQVIFLPLLGSLADFTNLKKRLLILFATIGAVATILLGLVSGAEWVLAGGLMFILANFHLVQRWSSTMHTCPTSPRRKRKTASVRKGSPTVI